jgi:hypothetical protein
MPRSFPTRNKKRTGEMRSLQNKSSNIAWTPYPRSISQIHIYNRNMDRILFILLCFVVSTSIHLALFFFSDFVQSYFLFRMEIWKWAIEFAIWIKSRSLYVALPRTSFQTNTTSGGRDSLVKDLDLDLKVIRKTNPRNQKSYYRLRLESKQKLHFHYG